MGLRARNLVTRLPSGMSPKWCWSASISAFPVGEQCSYRRKPSLSLVFRYHSFLPMRAHFPLVIYQVLFFLYSDPQGAVKPLRKKNQVIL